MRTLRVALRKFDEGSALVQHQPAAGYIENAETPETA